MGLDINGVRFLLHARATGADFSDFAMIGRQGLHLGEKDLGRALTEFGEAPDAALLRSLYSGSGGYAEALLGHLGAQRIDSFDYSDYEQATHVHDMNRPIPAAFKGRYSVVLDSGSLEHIFDFPTAIRNCMEMVRVGGHFLGITPANNFLGHGFYQFSPELFFRIFTPENGFVMDRVIAFEARRNARWFQARDPQAIRRRVTFSSSTPTYLLVMAHKTADCEPFANTPQQSDYVADWSGAAGKRSRWSGSRLSRNLYKPIERQAKKVLRLFVSGFNRRFFEPFDPRPRR